MVLCSRKFRAVIISLLIGSFLFLMSCSSIMVRTSLVLMLVYMSTMSNLLMVVSSVSLKLFSLLIRLKELCELNGWGGRGSLGCP